jgi:hypothetical protein
MKKTMYLALIGLMISLMTLTSRAGSVVQTSLAYSTATPALTEIDISYAGAGTITGLTLDSAPAGTVIKLGTPTTVNVDLMPANGGPASAIFTFTSSMPFSSISVSDVAFTPKISKVVDFSLNLAEVPEPTSLSMIGIGLTGLLVFRRLFRRRPPS